MKRPNPSHCIDAVVPLLEVSPDGIIRQLRNGVSPGIRSLEQQGLIIWYCFLVHDRGSADREDLPAEFPQHFLHLRFGLPDGADIQNFLTKLPPPFVHPVQKALGPIGGVNVAAMHGDWAEAWWLIGELSELALKLVEAHSDDNQTIVPQVIQFLHYLTNGLGMGGRSVFFYGGFQQF